MRHLLVLGSFALALFAMSSTVGCAVAPEEGEEEESSISEELRKQCGTGKTTPGLDVSYFQGNVDFTKVRAAGQRFVIARTNDGNFIDPKFVTYFKQAKAAGLVVGAYYFHRAGLEHQSPGRQADIMLRQLAAAGYDPKTDLPPTVDVENATFQSSPGQATAARELQAVFDRIEKRTGRKAILYTNASFESGIGRSTFGAYPLWSAYYFNSGSAASNCPGIAATGAKTWTLWQHCKGEGGAGQCQRGVSGVPIGRPDQNVFNGSYADLVAFARGDGKAPSTMTPPQMDSCFSETLDRDVPENTCVQSATDGKWYQCTDGGWAERALVPAKCVAEYPRKN